MQRERRQLRAKFQRGLADFIVCFDRHYATGRFCLFIFIRALMVLLKNSNDRFFSISVYMKFLISGVFFKVTSTFSFIILSSLFIFVFPHPV